MTTTLASRTGQWSPTVTAFVAHTVRRLFSEEGAPTPEAGWPVSAMLAGAAATVSELGLPGKGGRHASARQHVACLTAVYARWFCPTTEARPLRDTHRSQLRWLLPTGDLLVDVLLCGHNDPAPSTGRGSEELADVPLDAVVRVLRLSAPRTSRISTESGWQLLLPDTTAALTTARDTAANRRPAANASFPSPTTALATSAVS